MDGYLITSTQRCYKHYFAEVVSVLELSVLVESVAFETKIPTKLLINPETDLVNVSSKPLAEKPAKRPKNRSCSN
ncbi:hypothetical protein [Oenococcus phage fOg44]|nr:hypothetical protein [Oenococcus phage fOg44]